MCVHVCVRVCCVHVHCVCVRVHCACVCVYTYVATYVYIYTRIYTLLMYAIIDFRVIHHCIETVLTAFS